MNFGLLVGFLCCAGSLSALRASDYKLAAEAEPMSAAKNTAEILVTLTFRNATNKTVHLRTNEGSDNAGVKQVAYLWYEFTKGSKTLSRGKVPFDGDYDVEGGGAWKKKVALPAPREVSRIECRLWFEDPPPSGAAADRLVFGMDVYPSVFGTCTFRYGRSAGDGTKNRKGRNGGRERGSL